MKILITGANGFLGGECLKRLLVEGHEVFTSDRVGPANFPGDLTDAAFVKSLPDTDAVLHCASIQYFSPGLPLFHRREYFYRNNTLGTRNLTERYSGTGAHFVYVSTSMIYEPQWNGFLEVDSRKKENGIYSASKIAAQEFVEKMGNPYSIVIPCIIAGTGRSGLFARLVSSMKRFGIAPLPGKGTHPVHVVHVEDAASLISIVLEKRATGPFHAADPEPVSIQKWIEEIAAELELKSIKQIRIPLKPVETLSALFGYVPLAKEQLLQLRYPHVLSIEESLKLGWVPRWNNVSTIRATARALG